MNTRSKTITPTLLFARRGSSHAAVFVFGLLLLLGLALTQTAMAQFTEVNYAPAGTASASSEGYGGVATRGNDGNTDGNWGGNSVTHTLEDPGAFWEVVLEAAQTVGRVQVWFRTDCCFERNSDLQLVIYDNVYTELKRVPLVNPFYQTPSSPWTAVNFAPAIANARVVRVERANTGFVSLAEVQVIAPYSGVTINVTQPAGNQTAVESRTATFGPVAATVVGAPQDKLTLQWQRNGVDIPGAVGPTYTTPILTMANSNDTYTAKFLVSGVSASSSATLAVQKDTVPPTVVSANSIGGTVGILFDWLMDPASAATLGNYTMTGPATVTSARLASDGRSVVLGVSGVAGTFSVTINGVKDLGGNPIAANTVASGSVDTSLTGQNIGAPAIAGSVYSTAVGQYSLTGGGQAAFNGAADQMFFLATTVTGDFDKKAKLTSITATNAADNWARGGLMARVSNAVENSVAVKLTVGNPNGANTVVTRVRTDSDTLADPAPPTGWNRVGRDNTGVKDALPNQWIRLQRVGNAFFFYVGSDGENWSLIGERYIKNMPDTLQVGLYAASSQVDSVATAAFGAYGNVTSTDATPPTLVSAGTFDKKLIGVKFSEKVSSATAKLIGNYTLSQGNVTAAEVGINGNSVYLTVNGLTASSFTVTVSGVKDSAGNLIAANSQVSGSVSAFKATDVGRFVDVNSRPQATDNPYDIGKFVALSSGANVEVDNIAAGANLWDGLYFHFVYVEKTGDFDMQVEVARMTHSSGGGDYAHGGLMARAGLYNTGEEYTDLGTKVPFEMNTTYEEASPAARAALVLYCVNAHDTAEGVGNIVGTGTTDINGWAGYFGNLRAINAKGDLAPGSSPMQNRWLRLKRVGEVFTHYWSYDGVNWVKYQERDRSAAGPLPATLLVGYAAQVNDSCCNGAGVNGKPGVYGTSTIRALGDTQVTKPILHVDHSGTTINLKWLAGVLQSSPNVVGPYTDVLVSGTNAPSPYSNTMSGSSQFYKLRQ